MAMLANGGAYCTVLRWEFLGGSLDLGILRSVEPTGYRITKRRCNFGERRK